MKLLRLLQQRLRSYWRLVQTPPYEHGGVAFTIAHSCLEALSPFHLVLDGDGTILSSGESFRLVHGGCPSGIHVQTTVVERDGAESHVLDCTRLDQLAGRSLRLELRANPDLEFAAQLIPMACPTRPGSSAQRRERWILDLRPILETFDDLESSGLSLQDLSLLDPMRVSMVSILMQDSLHQQLLLGTKADGM